MRSRRIWPSLRCVCSVRDQDELHCKRLGETVDNSVTVPEKQLLKNSRVQHQRDGNQNKIDVA